MAQKELEERVNVLARVRFLAGLPRSSLAAMASHQEIERFGTGDIVFTAGSAGDRFYIVRSGQLD